MSSDGKKVSVIGGGHGVAQAMAMMVAVAESSVSAPNTFELRLPKSDSTNDFFGGHGNVGATKRGGKKRNATKAAKRKMGKASRKRNRR